MDSTRETREMPRVECHLLHDRDAGGSTNDLYSWVFARMTIMYCRRCVRSPAAGENVQYHSSLCRFCVNRGFNSAWTGRVTCARLEASLGTVILNTGPKNWCWMMLSNHVFFVIWTIFLGLHYTFSILIFVLVSLWISINGKVFSEKKKAISFGLW